MRVVRSRWRRGEEEQRFMPEHRALESIIAGFHIFPSAFDVIRCGQVVLLALEGQLDWARLDTRQRYV